MPMSPRQPDGGTSYRPALDKALERRAAAPSQPVQSYQPYRQQQISSNSQGQYSRPIAPPVEQPGPVQDINAFLGSDTGYQDQMRQFAQALSDFNADVTRRRGSLDSEFGLSKRAMEDQRIKDLHSLEEDYGARGILRSGLYGKAVGDYEGEYGKRQSDLSRRNTDALGQLDQETGQYKSKQSLAEQAAREAAIARRAAMTGL